MKKKLFFVDTNSAGDGWIQVTISGEEVSSLTEKQIEEALHEYVCRRQAE